MLTSSLYFERSPSSSSSSSSSSSTFSGWGGFFSVSLELPPEDLPRYFFFLRPNCEGFQETIGHWHRWLEWNLMRKKTCVAYLIVLPIGLLSFNVLHIFPLVKSSPISWKINNSQRVSYQIQSHVKNPTPHNYSDFNKTSRKRIVLCHYAFFPVCMNFLKWIFNNLKGPVQSISPTWVLN